VAQTIDAPDSFWLEFCLHLRSGTIK
jgi:hypothetical protein